LPLAPSRPLWLSHPPELQLHRAELQNTTLTKDIDSMRTASVVFVSISRLDTSRSDLLAISFPEENRSPIDSSNV